VSCKSQTERRPSALSISEVESGCWAVYHVVDKKYGIDPAEETLPLPTSLGLAGSDARACWGQGRAHVVAERSRQA
jgi:hypothetical protein